MLAGYFVLCLLVGAVSGYTLQALSDKTDAAPPWLAWAPLFQVHSFLRAAESSYAALFSWIGGGIGLGIAGAWFSAGGSRPVGIVLLAVVYALGLVGWFARMLWHLAERRGVSGWVGLACFIPLLGPIFFYLGLHDGLVRASRIGVAIPLLLALLATLNLRLDLRDIRHLLETDGATRAGEMSAEQRALLEGWLRPNESADPPPSDAMGLLDRLRSWMPAAPAQDPATAATALDAVVCTAGTRMAGDRPPSGSALWCEREPDGVRRGPYVAWHPNGTVAESGRYANGQRQGVWTRFWQSGGRRAQVHFESGREHGVLLVWDELGRQEREIRYEHGEPAPLRGPAVHMPEPRMLPA